jgi:threonine dehydratase
VAAAGKLCAAAVTIFASEHASPIKLDAMRNLGAEVVLVAGGYGEAEQAGIAYAHNHQKTWVSPYNDGQVIAGQGTIALEIIEQLPVMPESLTWIVPVGGGGLIAGIGSALRSHATSSNHHLIGVQSEASPYFHAINYTGTQAGVKELPSLADGLSGAVEEGSITIPLVRQTVDHMLLVKEAEIARAIAFAYHQYAEIIEGSAATALAAVLTGKINLRPAVVIVSGGNIQPELHQQVCQQWDQHIIAGYTE